MNRIMWFLGGLVLAVIIMQCDPAKAGDTVLPGGGGGGYGSTEMAVAACAAPVEGYRVKRVELPNAPGNCVTVKYQSEGRRSCTYSTGPLGNEDTMRQLQQICRNTVLPLK